MRSPAEEEHATDDVALRRRRPTDTIGGREDALCIVKDEAHRLRRLILFREFECLDHMLPQGPRTQDASRSSLHRRPTWINPF